MEGTPRLCLAKNNVTLANNHPKHQYQPPRSSYNSGQNFLKKMWSDQGLPLVQKTVFILAKFVNRWCAAACSMPSVWKSSPLAIIQTQKSGQLL